MKFRVIATTIATKGDDPTPVKVIRWNYTFDEQLDDATATRRSAEAVAGIRALADREGLQIDESKIQLSVLPPRCEDCDRIGAVCCDGCCKSYMLGFDDGFEKGVTAGKSESSLDAGKAGFRRALEVVRSEAVGMRPPGPDGYEALKWLRTVVDAVGRKRWG